MIKDMKFVTIMGLQGDIDRMVDQYLSKYEIHFENALTELYGSKSLRPYTSPNPYAPYLERVNKLWSYIKEDDQEKTSEVVESPSMEMLKVSIEQMENHINPYLEKDKNLTALKEEKEKSLEMISLFEGIDYPIERILSMDHIHFRFGRFTHSNYEKFKRYVLDRFTSIFIEGGKDKDYVYGIYFTPRVSIERVDALYISMNWERIDLPEIDDYVGTPKEIMARIVKEMNEIDTEINQNNKVIEEMIRPYRSEIFTARKRLEILSNNFSVRKYAALTHDEHLQKETQYLLMGWMAAEDADQLIEETDDDPDVVAILEDDDDPPGGGVPPTKIKNAAIFRPFEMFVKMYGIPNYRELDPTWIVALTYSLLFGVMFGDVGHGGLLALGGYFIYKRKKADLGGIIALAGAFATFFGLMYGSFFGFENLFPTLWLHPMTAMTELPFIGSMNTIFVVAIAFGMFMILTTLVINIMSEVKTHETKAVLFDRNGVAGLMFYASLVAVIILFMTGNPLPGGIVLGILFGLPLIMIALKEPILSIMEKKKLEGSEGPVMFVVQAFFEIFEILLSYFSNTLSFVRVGAFAVSHAAMMQVVMMLSGATEGGNINWFIVIIGNMIVIGLEGLVVGIQVLRLEFYEIFSHFYKGDGKPFENHMMKN